MIDFNTKKSAKSNTVSIDAVIVKKSYDYVINLLKKELSANFTFHSIEHMKEVLKYVEIIGNYHGFKDDDMNILRVCAIFHDIGYVYVYKGHEEKGAESANKFLSQNNIDVTQIRIVIDAILATKVPQTPKDIYSKILCDADLINLTYDDYFESAELLRQEWLNTGFAIMDEKTFHHNSVQFFKQHRYHTTYGQKYLEPKKRMVLKRIKERINQLDIKEK